MAKPTMMKMKTKENGKETTDDCVINGIIWYKCDAIFHSIGRSYTDYTETKSILIEQCTRFFFVVVVVAAVTAPH